MAYEPPKNPRVIGPTKIRVFDGIGGPLTQVLDRKNERGQNISNTVANEVYDFNLGRAGVMNLRDGSRKILNTGEAETVVSLIFINLGGKARYGVKHGSTLDVIDMKEWAEFPQEAFDFTPAKEVSAASMIYRAAEPWMPQ